jgi:class 3 adenylate cyclase/tetratricopeptide (TPR) repeat protein
MAEQERALANAERRHLTVFFCDLVESTALSEQLDPEDFGHLIAAYHAACTEVIERFHGHVAQYQGDGVLAYFGYPHALGDDTVQAVRAGLDVVRAVSGLARTRLESDGEVRLAARVGIDTGVVVVSEMGAGERRHSIAVGDTVNMAARLEKLADPETVVVSAAVERVTRGYFVFAGMNAVRVKGFADPITVYRVVDDTGIRTRLALAATGGLTPLVGRERELETLEDRWRLAYEGKGQAVLVAGEPGIGKSRVVHELGRRVGEDATRLVFQSSPYYAASALHPVAEELERALRIDRKAGDENSLARLMQEMEMQGLSLEETHSALASLLSIDEPSHAAPTLTPQEHKRQTFTALRALMAAETSQRPVLAVFEDIHWADPSTLELLGLLVADAAAQRILIVMTARPEFRPPWPTNTAFAKLSLARLERDVVDELMAAVLSGRTLPRGVLGEVADRSAGVPLFIEETIKMILEAELGDTPAIPGTLQNPLAARLDALGKTKEVAQVASVAALGGDFGFELLRSVTRKDEAELRESLNELVRSELLYERGTANDPVYVFKHALIREAAYESLLRSARRSFHARVAEVLEKRFPERVEHEPELIAQHLAEAGRTLDAIRYWQQAGERALRAWATEEAATHFEEGLGLVPLLVDGPQTRELELELQLARGTALMAARGYASPEAEAAYARAEALSLEVANPSRLAPALYGLGAFYASTAQPRKACEFGRRLLAAAEVQGDEDMLIEANVILAIAEYLKGDPVAALTSSEQVLAQWEPEKHRAHIFAYGQEPGIVSMTMAALAAGWLGRLDEALAFADEAERRGREAGHPLTLAYTLAGDGILYQLLVDIERAERTARELVTVASEHALPMWLAWGQIMRGWALLQRGQAKEGMAEINVGLAGAEAVHFAVMKIHFLGQLAETFGRLGHVSEGVTMLEEGFAALDATDERVSEAELHRSRGLLHLADNGNTLAAEACLRRAIEVARGQHALLLELRSATALAELLAGENRAEEARPLLADVVGRFTQGHETPVFQTASALLGRLGTVGVS